MSKYVDISEKVTATFYSEEYGEWTQQTVTIADVLDSVCDDYTTLSSAERKGHWIWKGEEGDSRFMCSVCHCKEYVPTCNGEPTIWEYCPNCGTRMVNE